ncbi:hypothetical protein BC937DRAFT_92831 [Endogone sp. FLAS-F59071]|nr:hypothetical protein BC937DRAFT_92831 [Endogone sp. FLAS-F59071]|eukprot:RUS15158.1 hypothetical protein BC937DRAFT_92831 [Endogone sp. FLAS-F59071]
MLSGSGSVHGGKKFMSLFAALLRGGRQRPVGSTSATSTAAGSLSAGKKKSKLPSIRDFEIIKPISRGAFGCVNCLICLAGIHVGRYSNNSFLPSSHPAFPLIDSKVYLARKKRTGDLYAIKILKKEDMVRKNMVNHVLAEKRVMSLSRTPFIVKLYFAFSSQDYLYLTWTIKGAIFK